MNLITGLQGHTGERNVENLSAAVQISANSAQAGGWSVLVRLGQAASPPSLKLSALLC